MESLHSSYSSSNTEILVIEEGYDWRIYMRKEISKILDHWEYLGTDVIILQTQIVEQ
jgi:hypothetical protein